MLDAIDTIAKSVNDRQKTLISAIAGISEAVVKLRKKYIEEIDKYKTNKGALVDLLPFDYLGPLKGTFYERAHTMIWAFLLNPDCSGPFSNIFLRMLLSDEKLNIEKVEAENTSVSSHQTQGKPDIAIDISGESQFKRVVIENKCLASESKNQTRKYVKGNSKKNCHKCEKLEECEKEKGMYPCLADDPGTIYLFIDYKGRRADCPRYSNLNYHHIKEAIKSAREKALKNHAIGKGKSLDRLIEHYVKSLDSTGKERIVIRYSDLESKDRLSLVQYQYLTEQIHHQETDDLHEARK